MTTVIALLSAIATTFSILGASCVFVHDILEVYIRVSKANAPPLTNTHPHFSLFDQ